jgi:hypothetical protein
MIIAGDIGATTARLTLVSPPQGSRKFVVEQEFAGGGYPILEPIISEFPGRSRWRGDLSMFRCRGSDGRRTSAPDQSLVDLRGGRTRAGSSSSASGC